MGTAVRSAPGRDDGDTIGHVESLDRRREHEGGVRHDPNRREAPRLSIVSLSMMLALATSLGRPLPGRAESPPEGESEAAGVIARFKEKDTGMTKTFREAHGYAVFPTVKKGGLGIGGARGKGYVYERGRLVGRSTLAQVTIGLQLGGQAYSEVVFFEEQAALDDFKLGRLKLDAQASAIALTARASGDLAYRKGVAIVTMAKGGLMYEASVGGQKFSFAPIEKHQ